MANNIEYWKIVHNLDFPVVHKFTVQIPLQSTPKNLQERGEY